MPPPPSQPPPRSLQSKPRRVHLVLRDGAEVEGGIFLNDGQALAPYLGSRKGGWVNLVAATWLMPVEETVNHAVLQADHVMYAYGVEGDVPVNAAQGGVISVRSIEVTLTNDARVRGTLAIADRQRLSDFLHTVGKFIPIVGAVRSDTGQLVGDIALNHSAVRVLRDTAPGGRATQVFDARTMGSSAGGLPAVPEGAPRKRASLMMGIPAMDDHMISHPSSHPPVTTPAPARQTIPVTPRPGGTPPTGAPVLPSAVTPVSSPVIRADGPPAAHEKPVRRTTIKGPVVDYVLEVEVPALIERRSGPRASLGNESRADAPPPRREPLRPSFRLNLDENAASPIEEFVPEEEETPFSPAVRAIAERAARHWLSLVADRFGLSPADPRKLGAEYTTEDLWNGIARANELTVDELAVHVATTFRLPVAHLDKIDPAAIAVLEEKVARQHLVCPVRGDDRKLVVACADPGDLEAEQALRFATRRTIEFEIAPPKAVRGAIDWWYSGMAPRATVPTPVENPPVT